MVKTRRLIVVMLVLSLCVPFAADASAKTVSEEQVTLRVAITQDPMVSDLVDNEFTHWMEEKTGVTLDMIVINPEVRQEKVSLMLNSGDYPDMFLLQMPYSDLLRYGMEEHIFIPITSYIQELGGNYLKVAERYPTIIEDLTFPDGEIYGMTGVQRPFHGSEQAGKLWINQTWLNNLGLSMPETTDEFADVLRAFKTQDPNGNGEEDEIPMTGCVSWNTLPHQMLMNAFCAYQPGRMLYFNNGEFNPQFMQDGFKNGLSYVAELYSENLIDPVSFTQSEANFRGTIDTDVLTVGAFNAGHLYIGMAMGSERCRDYEIVPPLTGSDGYQGVPWNGEIHVSNAYITITESCKNPEIAFKWADFLYSDEASLNMMWCMQGDGWDYLTEPGTTMLNEEAEFEWLVNYHNVTTNKRWNIQGLGQNDFNTRFAIRADIYSNEGAEARLGQTTALYGEYKDNYPYPFFQYTPEVSEEVVPIEAALKPYYDQWLVEFITGKKNVETDWDAFVQGMYDMQLQEYIDLVTDGYTTYVDK